MTIEPDSKPDRPGQIGLSWWAGHVRPADDTGAAKRTRAALRRVVSPVDAVSIEAVHEFEAALNRAGHSLRRQPTRLTLLAVALGHVKEHRRGHRAALAFGEPVGERRRLGAIRFEALIRATDPDDLLRPLVRALAVVDRRVDVAALADDLFHWSDGTRARWCFDYYGAPSAAPDETRSLETPR
jgi:CRISPR system Cascade subunit CasB